MAETMELIKLMQQQMAQQQQMMLQMQQQGIEDQEHFEHLIKHTMGAQTNPVTSSVTTAPPSFSPYDSATELWMDYYAQFCTFVGAHSIPDKKKAQVFLMNQSSTVYKLLAILVAQQTPPKDIIMLCPGMTLSCL